MIQCASHPDRRATRFRDFAVSTISVGQGLSNEVVSSVLAARDESVWLASESGLDRWDKGRIATLKVSSPVYLYQDRVARIWVATLRDFGYLDNNRFVTVGAVPGGTVRSIAEDIEGDLWVVNQDLGLFRLTRRRAVQHIPWARLGHKDYASALAADPVHGGLWLGFYNGGLVYFAKGAVRATYSAADGLGQGRVNALQFGHDGALWVATERGLSLISGATARTLAGQNGLPCDTVHWAMEDDNDGSFWLYMTCGLVRIARSELDAWVTGRARIVHATIFDSSDGVRSLAVYGGYGPNVAKSADSRLWFLPGDGVSVVDPRHLPVNKLPPPVQIEQVTADRKIYEGLPALHLPALTRDLEIDYTALSLVAPEKNLFRYKLEGRDREWQSVGTRRQALYNDLPPGNRFRVVASNNSGVWNEQGASLDFSIAPAYWQTRWFVALCVVTLMGLLWALYQRRLRQLARQFNMTLDARVGERTRIARELHDTLLQSFQGVLLRFQTASELLSTRPAEAKQTLDGAIDQAAQAITEGRDAVQGLRASVVESNDLAVAIRAFGEELAAEQAGDGSVVLKVVVEGTPRTLHPIQRDEIYRIACEALRNAFKHASATQIEVELRYDDRQLRLRVRDDGKGIDPQFLTDEGRAGHYGLHGMRERARLMSGKLIVWSALGSGTEVELSIPASRAYAPTSSTWRSWFAKKFSGEGMQSES